MRLHKVKRPAGVLSFEMIDLGQDEHGHWLHGPSGAAWEAPNEVGVLPFDVVVLLHPERWAVAWWIDDPADRRLGIDVCLPPRRTGDVWSFVDLELDPVRHEGAGIEIEDDHEFEIACRNGWISEQDAATAISVAATFERNLREAREPWGQEGWRRLEAARRAG